MTQLASMTVGRSRVQTRHALVCSIASSAHGYELLFWSPSLHSGLQDQVHHSLRPGLMLQRRSVTCTTESKSHRSRRIPRKR